jgi:hypothetical protein
MFTDPPCLQQAGCSGQVKASEITLAAPPIVTEKKTGFIADEACFRLYNKFPRFSASNLFSAFIVDVFHFFCVTPRLNYASVAIIKKRRPNFLPEAALNMRGNLFYFRFSGCQQPGLLY